MFCPDLEPYLHLVGTGCGDELGGLDLGARALRRRAGKVELRARRANPELLNQRGADETEFA
jgi:hypothetical protein